MSMSKADLLFSILNAFKFKYLDREVNAVDKYWREYRLFYKKDFTPKTSWCADGCEALIKGKHLSMKCHKGFSININDAYNIFRHDASGMFKHFFSNFYNSKDNPHYLKLVQFIEINNIFREFLSAHGHYELSFMSHNSEFYRLMSSVGSIYYHDKSDCALDIYIPKWITSESELDSFFQEEYSGHKLHPWGVEKIIQFVSSKI